MPLYSFGKFKVHPLREGQTIFNVAVVVFVLLIAGALYNRSRKK
jgi:hypothetical protein